MPYILRHIALFSFLALIMGIGLATQSNAQTAVFTEKPIIKAAQNGHYDKVRAELLKNEDVNTSGLGNVTVLITAAKKGYYDILEMALIEFSAFPNHPDDLGNTALFYAIDIQDYDAVALLTENGADVNRRNRQGETPLIWAAINGDFEIIQMLIDYGADPATTDFTGRTLVDHARYSRNPTLVDDLASLGIY